MTFDDPVNAEFLPGLVLLDFDPRDGGQVRRNVWHQGILMLGGMMYSGISFALLTWAAIALAILIVLFGSEMVSLSFFIRFTTSESSRLALSTSPPSSSVSRRGAHHRAPAAFFSRSVPVFGLGRPVVLQKCSSNSRRIGSVRPLGRESDGLLMVNDGLGDTAMSPLGVTGVTPSGLCVRGDSLSPPTGRGMRQRRVPFGPAPSDISIPDASSRLVTR